MSNFKKTYSSPRIKVIQKVYSHLLNPGEKIDYPKSQYKKFIKDVVEGTLERQELIEDKIKEHLSGDINLKRTDKILKIIFWPFLLNMDMSRVRPCTYVCVRSFLDCTVLECDANHTQSTVHTNRYKYTVLCTYSTMYIGT